MSARPGPCGGNRQWFVPTAITTWDGGLSGVAAPITAGWPTTQDLAVRREGGRPATKCFDCHISCRRS
jgi:hypothetical protein